MLTDGMLLVPARELEKALDIRDSVSADVYVRDQEKVDGLTTAIFLARSGAAGRAVASEKSAVRATAAVSPGPGACP